MNNFLLTLPIDDDERKDLMKVLDNNRDGYIDEGDLIEVLTPMCSIMNGTGYVHTFKRPVVMRREFWKEEKDLPEVVYNLIFLGIR